MPDKINLTQIAETHLEFHPQSMREIASYFQGRRSPGRIEGNQKVWAWGAHAYKRMSPYALRFKVNGHLHKGHVYLTVNASDYFDVYLTTTHGTIKEIVTDVPIENLIDIIDRRVERIPEYND